MPDDANNPFTDDLLQELGPEPGGQPEPSSSQGLTGDDPLLADLTPPQREAVTHVDGPLLVLAGAGSGKTRTITRRIAYLINREGIAPWHVLAITFTNKAAGEMKERVGQLLTEKQARAVTVATFHSLCARLLRQYADVLGLPAGYSIYDTTDQQRAVKQALQELEISPSNFTPAKILAAISNSKNELVTPAEYQKINSDFFSRIVGKVYAKYEKILEQNSALDFDDLLLKVVKLIQNHPRVANELRERFQYVLIDEYQDTNRAQFLIAHGLCSEHQNLCVSGDPDQSIYAWRGANIRNILDFEERYAEAKVVRLEQNYRSTKHILAAADALIANNTQRKSKALWTANDSGEKLQVVTCRDERAEAKYITGELQQAHQEGGVPWGGMAVFYRMNSLSRVMEEALRDEGVPYQIARGTSFYERAEIKDAVAYLRLIVNPNDGLTLQRVINKPTRGIGKKSLESVEGHAVAKHLPIEDALRDADHVPGLGNRAVSAIGKFIKMVDKWRTTARVDDNRAAQTQPGLLAGATSGGAEPSLRSFVEQVLRESGLEKHYAGDKSDPDQEKLANLGELVTVAQEFERDYTFEFMSEHEREPTLYEKLGGLMERVSLVADIDSLEQGQGAVTLMTLHAAKGLEFPVVAMIGCEDGLLPHERSNDDPTQLEEERRLCFVGITRAMNRLYLTHAKFRTIFGQTMPTIPSRFLRELPPDAVESDDFDNDEDDFLGDDRFERASHQRSLARSEADRYPPGCLVKHKQFGVGRVLNVHPIGAQTRAQVEFKLAGVKTLVLQYAQLERVE